jgi:myo-inositol-1(or 4)-monophosphatase
MVHQQERRELVDVLVRAAVAGAAVIRAAAPRVRELDWRSKGPADFVSEVDLAAEERILALLARELPEAAVLAEETAQAVPSERLRAGLTAVVDPLDGTTNFLHGYPEYAVSIGLLDRGEAVAAVVLDVPGDECFTATAGGGTWLRAGLLAADAAPAMRCHVSTITDPRRALIGTGFPFKDVSDIEPYQLEMLRVMSQGASLDLASVAAGRFDAFWETMLAPWDFAAGALLVREAGGVATTVTGAPLPLLEESSVLAGNPVMYEWLRNQLGRP